MADVDFVGSHEKAFTKPGGVKGSASGYGQNGNPVPSAVPLAKGGQQIKGLSPSQAGVPGLPHENTLAHRVKMDGDKAAALPVHSGMVHRAANSGSPSGPVPAATIRRDSGKSLLK